MAEEFWFPKGMDAAAALSLYLYLQQLYDSGTAHTPDSLAVFLSADTAQNACLHSSCCIRSPFLCGRCLCVGHGTFFRTYNREFNCQITLFFVYAVVHQYLSAKVPNRLFDAVCLDAATLQQQLNFKPSPAWRTLTVVLLWCDSVLYQYAVLHYCSVLYCTVR